MLTRALKIIGFAVMLAMAAALSGEACAAEDDVAAYKRAVDKSFAAWLEAVSYTHLTLPTNREV